MGPSEPTSPNCLPLVGKGPRMRSPLNNGAMSSKLLGRPIVILHYGRAYSYSLRGPAADTVRNLGPDVPLDTIIKTFTIMYGNVKSFDLLMQDFYHADQGEEGSIPSFATQLEGLLSQIRDRFPDKLPHLEE